MEYAKVGNTDIEVSKLCIGCMSFGKAGVMHDWTPFAAMEDHYNLLYREDERELIPICKQMNVMLMPYSPLAAGHLARNVWNSDSIRSKTDRAARGKYDKMEHLT